jgi:hypothetical protein
MVWRSLDIFFHFTPICYKCLLSLPAYFSYPDPNIVPCMSSMVHNISIEYSCASNKLLRKDLCSPEVTCAKILP